MNTYWKKFPLVNELLEETADYIDSQIIVRNKKVEARIKELLHSGGKMLRPAYFFLFAGLSGQTTSKRALIQVAASLEILHMATLIHDDIIDDSPTRRGSITVQMECGKDVAVYAGDLLFTTYFHLLIEAGLRGEYLARNADAMRQVLLGELDQMNCRYEERVTIRQYIRVVRGKTGALFSLCCEEGAFFAGLGEADKRRAARAGMYIGTAFQILDDILDYTGDAKTVKKPVAEDVNQGVYTAPLIFALANNEAVIAPFLAKTPDLNTDELKHLMLLVRNSGGAEQARMLARRYTEKALGEIQRLPQTKAQKDLLILTQELLRRTN